MGNAEIFGKAVNKHGVVGISILRLSALLPHTSTFYHREALRGMQHPSVSLSISYILKNQLQGVFMSQKSQRMQPYTPSFDFPYLLTASLFICLSGPPSQLEPEAFFQKGLDKFPYICYIGYAETFMISISLLIIVIALVAVSLATSWLD